MTPKDLAGLGALGGANAIREHKVKRLALAVRPPPTGGSSDGPADAEVQLDEEAATVVCALDGIRALERGDQTEVAALLFAALERLSGAKPALGPGGPWRYFPREGLWKVVSKHHVGALVVRIGGKPIRTSEGEKPKTYKGSKVFADGIHSLVEDLAAVANGPDFFYKGPGGVPVANGFLVVDDAGAVILRAHDSGQRVRDRVQLAFDEHARAPAWDEALAAWFRGDPDASEKIAFLQEFIGSCLVGLAPKHQKCAVLLGAGANGKSAFIEVVRALFPAATVTAIPPQDFGDLRLGAELDRSRLNVVSEMPERAILASEAFKAAVSGDAMTRRQVYERPFTFTPRGGHLFASNALPPVVDTSDGFWRRLVLIKFDNRFEGDQRDNDLAARIKRTELPGVLAWAIRGAARLVQNNCYTKVPSSEAALAVWRRESNPVELWLEDRCVVQNKREPVVWTDAMALYRDYRVWALDASYRPVATREFGRRMKALPEVAHRKNSRHEYGVRLLFPTGGTGG